MSSDTEAKSDSINISDYPEDFQESLTLLDFDGDGKLSPQEIALAAKLYVAAKEETKVQTKQIYLLLIGYVVLAGTIGGMVYAIMLLTRQVEIDPMTGLVTVSSTGDIMKTSNALFHVLNATLNDLSGTELSHMKSIDLNDGNISFLVKGYAKQSNETVVLVEGGRIIFGTEGVQLIGEDIKSIMGNVVDNELVVGDGTQRDLHLIPYMPHCIDAYGKESDKHFGTSMLCPFFTYTFAWGVFTNVPEGHVFLNSDHLAYMDKMFLSF